tara:strand:+ start:684 stop:1970 length:1287 start_codon:yes stop_codon:yes gene_type:complete
MKNIYLFSLILLIHQNLFAYIDPGTGSILLSALVAIVASVFYSIKGTFYKAKDVLSMQTSKSTENDNNRLVFYSEGENYWNTFKPIIENLNKRDISATYLTSSKDDPGLSYESKTINTKFIGKRNSAFTYLNVLEADLFVTTTPGLDVSQIRRSKGVKHYSYIPHSPIDMGKYKLFSFDAFDSIFLSGPHQEVSIRALEKLRGSNQKKLYYGGCPYMDDLSERYEKQKKKFTKLKEQNNVILIAPTWGKNNLLRIFGVEPINELVKNGFEIIIRPHPQSQISEPELLEKIKKSINHNKKVKWDYSHDNFNSLDQSDLLISDVSGVIFDYAFIFKKPVISFLFEYDFLGLEGNDLPHQVWELGVLGQIGKSIKKNEIHNLSNIVFDLLTDSKNREESIYSLREASLYNFRKSGEIIANHLIEIMQEIKQ